MKHMSGNIQKKDICFWRNITHRDLMEHRVKLDFRVQPLDKTCRELNRKYVMPLGYALNNLLITNWDNQNYTELDFLMIFANTWSEACWSGLPSTYW